MQIFVGELAEISWMAGAEGDTRRKYRMNHISCWKCRRLVLAVPPDCILVPHKAFRSRPAYPQISLISIIICYQLTGKLEFDIFFW